MPKLSSAAVTKGGSQFQAQDGTIQLIEKAYSLIYEFPASEEMKAKGEVYPPSCQVVLELRKCDPKTFQIEEHEGEPIIERIGFGGKNGLDQVRPGQLKSPDQEEPADLGRALGTQGNSVYCEANISIADNCPWMVFTGDKTGLQKAGFKPEYIASGWLGYLEGTIFEVERVKAYKNPNKTYKSDPTNLGVKRVIVYGYEKGAGKDKGKGASVKANASSGTASASTSTAPVDKPNGHAATPDQTVVVDAIAKQIETNAGKEIKRSALQMAVMTWLMQKTKLDMKGKNDLINSTVKDDGWLTELATSEPFVGRIVIDFENGMVAFPAE